MWDSLTIAIPYLNCSRYIDLLASVMKHGYFIRYLINNFKIIFFASYTDLEQCIDDVFVKMGDNGFMWTTEVISYLLTYKLIMIVGVLVYYVNHNW